MNDKYVGLRQLGRQVSRILQRVKRGESMVVTEFGTPIARLTPVGEPRSLEEAISMGRVTPAREDWRDLLSSELVALPGHHSVSKTLEQLRRDER
jgi:prevent-host-death family protein